MLLTFLFENYLLLSSSQLSLIASTGIVTNVTIVSTLSYKWV